MDHKNILEEKRLGDYSWILFDADETLFHFDAFRGLGLMFSGFGMTFTRQDYEEYERINKPLWVDYQNGAINAQQLQHRRFAPWADKLEVSAQHLNSTYMAVMAEICTPLDGAVSLLNAVKGQYQLGIITNGFTELQQARLDRTGFKDHFELIVISEEVGHAKPHPQIFEHTLYRMGNPSRDQVLMVGDNPDSDILGGLNAGLHTCWLNTQNKAAPEGITPHFEVSSLKELERMLVRYE
ncbi:haloacid dehalogenase [Legionella moravica]|uniref:Haloacid dehalogenase n=1 Tax=Legionella moravica TaxID=39962 RepID=A0A378K1K5_9GAMM|nr:pyrimidine 5'-nucleotidase [Legionella moravica]KTD30995.1 haloacid dehalogenase [Legionella moravica]STX63572.1 haloacid dehalogenase [Legionella moravica]